MDLFEEVTVESRMTKSIATDTINDKRYNDGITFTTIKTISEDAFVSFTYLLSDKCVGTRFVLLVLCRLFAKWKEVEFLKCNSVLGKKTKKWTPTIFCRFFSKTLMMAATTSRLKRN